MARADLQPSPPLPDASAGDRELLADLRRVIARADPVPSEVVAGARASLGWAETLASLRALEHLDESFPAE